MATKWFNFLDTNSRHWIIHILKWKYSCFLDAGSDLQGIRTNAKRDGDDFILNGSKVFITNGILADVVVVVAITDANAKAKAHGISLFVVEDGMKGFKKGRNL